MEHIQIIKINIVMMVNGKIINQMVQEYKNMVILFIKDNFLMELDMEMENILLRQVNIKLYILDNLLMEYLMEKEFFKIINLNIKDNFRMD